MDCPVGTFSVNWRYISRTLQACFSVQKSHHTFLLTFPGEILLQFGYLLTSPCPLYGWFLCTAYEMHKKVTTITKKLFLPKNLPFYSFFVLFLKCFLN